MDIPKVIPINELKNTSKISQICNDSSEPIVITKNGYSDMVIMSVESYEKKLEEVRIAAILNESIERLEKGEKPINGEEFFNILRKKYGENK